MTARFTALCTHIREHFPTLRAVALTSGARAYSALITLVGLILTVWWLGAEGRGVVVVATTWVTLVANLGSLSLWQVAVHRSVESQGKPWLGPFLGALVVVSAAATALGWMIVALLVVIGGNSLFAGIPYPALALAFAALPFVMWEMFGNALLSVIGKLGLHNLNQVIGRTVGLVLLIVSIKLFDAGIYGFLLSFLVTEILLSAVGVTVVARRATGKLRDGLKQLRRLVQDGLRMHLQIVGALLYSGVDILLVHRSEGVAAAGIYQFASALFLALLLIPQASVLALQSKVASIPLPCLWPEHRFLLILVTSLMTVVAAIVWIAAPWITVTLATREFSAAGGVLRIFMLAVPAASFVWMMTVQWLARGHFLRIGLIYFIMGVGSVLLNLLLIPRYGASGAAVTAVIIWYAIPLVPAILMGVTAAREARSDRRGQISAPVSPTEIVVGPSVSL